MRGYLLLILLAMSGTAGAQASEPPIEQMSLGTSLAILGFLLLAALIVISVLCQLLLAVGLVPKKGKIRGVMLWLANVVSNVRTTSDRKDSSSGSAKSGGGSFGGGGSTGNW